jgi:hypothetical protein
MTPVVWRVAPSYYFVGGGGGVASVMSFELARKSDPHVIMLGGFL